MKKIEKKYIKNCIENLGLSFSDIIKIIKDTNNSESIKYYVEYMSTLGIDVPIELILLSGDIEFIEKCEKTLNLKDEDTEELKIFTNKSYIKLLPEMTIGIEIESEGQDNYNTGEIYEFLRETDWEIKMDTSLIKGTEVVSPILTGNMEKASNEIRNVCAVLNGIPQTVSERCGGHVHIGADYLKTKQDMVNLIKILSNAEMVLYIISNEKGKIPRELVMEYAPPISGKFEKAIKDGTINLEKEEDLEKLVKEVAKVQGKRYSSINFCNIGNKDNNTIEFRLSNGTINPNTWIENTNLFGGIIKVSHELAEIQSKKEEQRTEEEKRLLKNFENLLIEKDEKKLAKSLIDLCIVPEDRYIYMDRYTINRLLLDASPKVKNAIMQQVSTSEIGKKTIIGKDSINEKDYRQGKQIIEDEIEQYNDNNLKRK